MLVAGNHCGLLSQCASRLHTPFQGPFAGSTGNLQHGGLFGYPRKSPMSYQSALAGRHVFLVIVMESQKDY